MHRSEKTAENLGNGGREGTHVLMDKAYDCDEKRHLALEIEMLSTVPQKRYRLSACGNMTKNT